MRLQLLSDLHFEFHRDGGRSFVDSLDPTGSTCWSSRVTSSLRKASVPHSRCCAEDFVTTSLVYVYGNHEFHGSDCDLVIG
jgi:hypothetical protein